MMYRLGRLCLQTVLLCVCVPVLFAHHFKGMPHFNYFENYPQIPQEDFIVQSGDYEFQP